MAERDVVDPTGGPSSTVEAVKQMDPYGIPELDEARMAEVLVRSQAMDHLEVELPPGYYGEWVPRLDEMEIYRKESLGFRYANSDMAKSRFVHSDGTGRIILGDCVYMINTIANRDKIQRVRDAQYKAQHSPKKKSKEQKEYEAEVSKETGGLVPTYSEHDDLEQIDGTRIEAAITNK